MRFVFATKILRLRPLADAIDVIAKAGFSGVELMADRPHAFPEDLGAPRISALNQSLGGRKLKVSSLNASAVTAVGDAHNPTWLEEDWQKRELRIRYTLDCLRLASVLGVPAVTILPGGPIPKSTNRGDAWRLFVASLHRILPLARKLGVQVLLEPSPEMLIATSSHLLEFLNEFEFDPNLKVGFDVVHLFCVGENPLEAYEQLKAHVGLVRLADAPENRDHCHLQLGEGVLDLQEFLKGLEASGYQGFVSVQPDCHDQNVEKIIYGAAGYLQEAGFIKKKLDYCVYNP
jgi:sugar phosphate isomerase/epimerase